MRSKNLPVLILFLSIALVVIHPTAAALTTDQTNSDSSTSAKPTTTQKEVIKTRLDNAKVKEPLMQRKPAFLETLEQKRAEAKEQFLARRETFKDKLETIKDEQKKAIVEKVDAQLSTINQNRTNHMSEILEKLEAILSRIASKSAEHKAAGQDTKALDATIVRAENAIATAKTAVANQAGKEYIATLGSETTLRTTVGSTVSKLQSDLQIVHKLVIAAKQAVQNTIPKLAKLGGVGNKKIGTDSAKPTEVVTPTSVVTPTGV